MIVVPKCTGDHQPILHFKWFSWYMHIPTFKMPTIRHVWQFIQCGDCVFSIDFKASYLHNPIVKHHHNFYDIFGKIHHNSGRFSFWAAGALMVLTKPILFFCCTVIYLDDILVLIHSKEAGRRE